MKLMKKMLTVTMIGLLFILNVWNVIASESTSMDMGKSGQCSISITLCYDEQPISDGVLELYHIADLDWIGTEYVYTYTPEFSDCEVPMEQIREVLHTAEQDAVIEELVNYIDKQETTGMPMITDANGKAEVKDLKLGIYLIIPKQFNDLNLTCSACFVTIPLVVDGTFYYQVEAAPKLTLKVEEAEAETEVETEDETEVPTEEEIQTTYEYIEETEAETQVETEVVEPTEPTSPAEPTTPTEEPTTPTEEPTNPTEPTEPTTTPAPELPNTGQLWWPVPILAIAGVLITVIGWIWHRKSEMES